MVFEIVTIIFLSGLTLCAYFICRSLDKDLKWFDTNSKDVENKINTLRDNLIDISQKESTK